MSETFELTALGRLPSPADNAAIAIRRIEEGTVIRLEGQPRILQSTILEGHRFAVRAVAPGEKLLSWGRPFGVATRSIAPGDYVSNAFTLEALAKRDLKGAVLPAEANFENRIVPFAFDESAFQPAEQVALAPDAASRTFQGYPRRGGRGTGIRNFVVILGTTSRTASFARQLAERLGPLARLYPGLDGIVPISHTEGESPERAGADAEAPHNRTELLRTLAGFMLNPNVGAVLAVDYGIEAVNNGVLRAFMERGGYPLESVPHEFMTIHGSLAAALETGERIVRAWLPTIGNEARVPAPLSGLRIGLQCGGSDAFSGVSSNPLVGAVSREVVRHGGTVNLAETDEQIGAESYVLAKVKDLTTARRFLAAIARFKERLGWHGATVEGNPSAGNRFRGLYNIVLKSLGSAMKKDPALRLDHVIDYAELMREPGFYFMDSPGNDLESIAGQVGAGCNLIFFSTGNGSVTNFPFVPTLKVTSTTQRHRLLEHEMDVNAGAYLDGTAMDQLTREMFQLVQDVASGRRTKGEMAGHSQVSIWRNWRQADSSHLTELRNRTEPSGEPLPLLAPAPDAPAFDFAAFPRTESASGWASDRIGLIIPASMCSSQIARLAADRLNEKGAGAEHGISRFAALAHTEGCGFTGETLYATLQRTYRGYAVHPNVVSALFLEHGCEKVPNDLVRRHLESARVDPARFGWASVQLDGGIGKVLDKIEAWFGDRLAHLPAAERRPAGLEALTLGLMTESPIDPATAQTWAALARLIVGAGGSILIPESDPLLAEADFVSRTLGSTPIRATLAYGEPLAVPGFHAVATESEHWVENATGLGACGAHLILGLVSGQPQQGHPFVPIVQVAQAVERGEIAAEDLDGVLSGEPAADLRRLLELIAAVAGGHAPGAAAAHGFTSFQLSRGLFGVST